MVFGHALQVRGQAGGTKPQGDQIGSQNLRRTYIGPKQRVPNLKMMSRKGVTYIGPFKQMLFESDLLHQMNYRSKIMKALYNKFLFCTNIRTKSSL